MVSISQERERLADAGMRLILREQWGARRSYRDARTVIEPARQVFIHISVTNPSAYRSHAAHVRGIEAIGIARFPNTGISYNRVIVFGVGTAYEAQPMGRRGAHTVNDHRRSTCTRFVNQCPGYKGDLTAPSWNLNYTARAYVYGALCGHAFTDSVLDTFARTIAADKRAGLVDRDAKIHGHRCVSSKSCPCDQIWARMHELDQRIEHYLSDELEPAMTVEIVKKGLAEAFAEMQSRETKYGRHAGSNLLGALAKAGLDTVIADAVADKDGFFDGPPSNARVQDGSNTTWKLKSHIKNQTEYAMYRIPAAIAELDERERATAAKLDALMEAHQGQDLASIRAHVDQHYAEAAAERAELSVALVDANEKLDVAAAEHEALANKISGLQAQLDPANLAVQLAALLPAVTQEQLEQALRSVLGSLDE